MIGDLMFEDYSIYFEKYGQGKETILILPGWGHTRKTFTYLINLLKDTYTIYIVDYPGFGNSLWANKDLTIYDYTNMIRDLMEKENIKNPIIIAHSFGGRIAILLSGYYKENIKKLILIDIAGIKRRKKLRVWFKEKIYKILKRISKNKNYQNYLTKLFASPDYKTLPNNMKKTFQNILKEDLKYYLSYISQETLIIWGSLDKDTPLKDGKLIKQKIKNSEIIIYPKAKHFTYLEYPYLTYQIIKKFL